MKNDKAYYGSLLTRFIDNDLPLVQVTELFDWIRDEPEAYKEVLNTTEIQNQLIRFAVSVNLPEELTLQLKDRLIKTIAAHEQLSSTEKISIPLTENIPSRENQPFYRILSMKTTWLRYASVLIIFFGIGTYLWTTQQKKTPETSQSKLPVQNDILPGGNKAVLTLSDGTAIILDSAAIGILAQQGGSTVRKFADGQIVYEGVSAKPVHSEVVYNTMSTPKGGEYSVSLPDGSRVWLNAASSVTYPTEFIGKERVVSITGEAYFEVTKNPAKPFKVRTHKNEITVLGTSFNVNCYEDEPIMKTSLLEGAVRIGDRILKPGQAYLDGQVRETNLEQDMAWKNGVFNFEDKSLDEVMRQLSRWYDLEVVYPKGIPKIEFGGGLKRSLKLSQLLKVLERSEVHFQLEGHRLIVKP